VAEAWTRFLAGMLDGSVLNKRRRPYKPAACRSYERAMRLRVLPHFGHRRLSDVTRGDVQRFVDELIAERLGASTIANTLDPLRAVFRFALRREEVGANPVHDLDLPASDETPRRAATPAEALELLAALPDFERALYATAIYTGMRRGELQALRWSDISDLDGELPIINVTRAYDDEGRGFVDVKSDAGVRKIGVVEPLQAELRAHRKRSAAIGDALVFGRTAEAPFVPSTARRHALEAWKAADDKTLERARREGRKVEPGELLLPLTLHEGRHTQGSDGSFAGLDDKSLAHLMGHSSVVITKDRYGHMTDAAIRDATAKMNAYYATAATEGGGS
jgi:integrase